MPAKEKKIPKKKKRFTYKTSLVAHCLLCTFFFVYLEIIFHIFTYKHIGQNILYPILFSLPAGLLLLFVSSIFTKRMNKIILWFFMPLVIFIYIIETVYQNVFKIPLLVSDLSSNNTQVIVYYREILTALLNCLPAILLMLLPLIVYGILLGFKMRPVRKRWTASLLILSLSLNFYGVARLAVHLSDQSQNNIYENFYEFYDAASAMENYGVATAIALNIQNMYSDSTNDFNDIIIDDPIIFDDLIENDTSTEGYNGTEDNTQEQEPVETIDTSPNMLDIDFVSLAESATDSNIKLLHQYFASVMPTNKNEYTGMFEGYNLIHITAEAFSPYCIDEELTPTLHKLVNNGFVFNNFYVPPTGESTCGGEFMNMTGLLTNPYRPRGTSTFQQIADNYMPYGLGNVFSKMGMTCYAYHNNSLSYYTRYKTIPSLGYHFKAALNGSVSRSVALENDWLFTIENPNAWPQSDLEMIAATGSEYIISDNPFHAYYMTVSGHANYNFDSNSMARKHQQEVADLPYSEACRAYIACNIELDQALTDLIEQLDAAGVLEKTVICLTADHYPYGLTNDQISELAGHEIESTIELHKNSLILWNSAMKDPVIVDKACSSIDVVPTLLNLFGIEYDSRLLTGKDILSDAEGYVWMTSNNSFICGNIMYNSRTRAVTDLEGNTIQISEDELNQLKDKGTLMVRMNSLLIEEDYYNVIREYFE